MDEKKSYLFKVLVIGDSGVGKTSIIDRYVHQVFSQQYKSTIGVDFALKHLLWNDKTTVRLQLWDIAGQERYGHMTRIYFKEAAGALVVYDVQKRSTFDAANKWKADLDAKVILPNGNPIPAVLLGNKCDETQFDTTSNKQAMDKYCREENFVEWFATSAKGNINIDEAVNCLVREMMENVKGYSLNTGDNNVTNLDADPQALGSPSRCCHS